MTNSDSYRKSLIITRKETGSKGNLYFVDLLTVIAALGIFLCHLTHVLAGFHVIDYLTFPVDFFYSLQWMVQLFFILSGFKIALSIRHEREEGTFSYGKFILRRFNAIWFVYALAIIAYLIFRFYFRQEEYNSLSVWDYLANFALLNGFFPTSYNTVVAGGWFIGCIFLYYLMSPLLIKICKKPTGTLILLAVAMLIRHLFSLTIDHPWGGIEVGMWNTFVSQSFPMHFCFFALGLFLERLLTCRGYRYSFIDLPALTFILLYLGFINDEVMRISALLFLTVCVASLIQIDSRKFRIIPLLSKTTYTVYLFQMLLLRTLAMFFPYSSSMSDSLIWWITLLIALPVLIAFGLIVHFGIIRPVNLLYRKLFPRAKNPSINL